MTFTAYSFIALPLWCVFFALYFILRDARLMRESLLAKCAGSFLAVGSAGLSVWLAGDSLKGQRPALFVAFFVLCMAADALLEITFVPGMLLFGAGHICLCVWLLGTAGFFPWWAWLLWIALVGCAAFLFRKELSTLGALLPAFLGYAAVLSLTLTGGLLRLHDPSLPGGLLVPLGCLCFFVSDMMVAKMEIGDRPDSWQKPVMLLYWLALYLLSSPCWP